MLRALFKSFKRLLLWVFGHSHFLRVVDGTPRILKKTFTTANKRRPFLVPTVIGGKRHLLIVTKMPDYEPWTVIGADGPIIEMAGILDGEWCLIQERAHPVAISDEIIRDSFFPGLITINAKSWGRLDVASMELIMTAAIIRRWLDFYHQDVASVVHSFYEMLPVDVNGVPGLYASINGVVVVDEHGKANFAKYVSEDYFRSLPVREEYIIEADVGGEQLVYTISDCPDGWYVQNIDHEKAAITYVSQQTTSQLAYRSIAQPGSYVQAMEPEQRKAVLSEWAIPTNDVNELQRMAHMSAAELLDPEPVALDVGDDEDVTKLADELYGPSSDTAAEFSQKYSSWDRMPKWADKKFHATEQREWTFLIEIDQFPLNCEVAYVIPGQYQQDGPIEAVVAFKPIGGGPTVICPFHCPVVEMRPVNNIHHCGDEYRTKDIVVLSRGWRYMFRDCWVPKNCMVSDERLVRNNPTGKPLITFEYVYESGPMVGKVAVRRFVVPSQVARAGSNNQRKGKRQRGIGKRR